MTADFTAADRLTELDRLREAATAGPWRRNSQPGVVFGEGADRPMPIAAGYTRPDAALIVAAVNALPELIAAVRAVLDVADEYDGYYSDAADRIRAAVASALDRGTE